MKGKYVKQAIERKIPELVNRVFPGFTSDLKKPSVTYAITPTSGEYVPTVRLETRLIWSDYDDAEELAERVSKVFNTPENAPTVALDSSFAFRGKVVGGGILFNEEFKMWEFTSMFILKIKEK